MAKISIMLLALAATIVAVKAEPRVEIDEVRSSLIRAVNETKNELVLYARMRLSGSADASSRSQEDCVMHMVRQYAVAARALRFRAFQRLTLAAVDIMSTRFDIRNPEAMRESFKRQGEPVEKYVAMTGRAMIRGTAEGIRLSRPMLSLLLLTARDNPNMKSNFSTADFDLQIEAIDAWPYGIDDLINEIQAYVKDHVRAGKLPSNIIDTIDEELDSAISFYDRQDRVYEPELYNTYAAVPVKFATFFLEREMENLVGFKMTRCEGVRHFQQSEIDAAVREQIDALRRKEPLRIW